MENKSTPGPWRVGNYGAVVTDNQVGVKPIHPETRQYYGGDVICETVTPSNARLISVAPDFYEAAKGVLAAFEAKVFVRNTDGDSDPKWAIKAFPHLQALAKLAKAVDSAGGQ